jgi:hypothetical protein
MDEENAASTHTGVLISEKKNKIMSFARKWMGLEIIMLSAISQTHKKILNLFSHMLNLKQF